ncbi:DedA family protein [Candidatus Peregrinibacteria bacterium]|nr:DedA family protein [Candidatus Peregrinibacteria bacterium]
MIDLILHLDANLIALVQAYGPWVYAIVFAVIFCETGLVVTPFLPGDSLLFALGALAATKSLNLGLLLVLLGAAAILGDTVNYWIGHTLEIKLVEGKKIRFIKESHLKKTEEFYKKYGNKTIILARFAPIVRTLAPFVAGVGKMNYSHFLLYNIIGGAAWVTLFLSGGYFFGNIPFVKKNFTMVILGIIFFSVLPAIIEYIKSKKRTNMPSTVSTTVERDERV